MYELKYYNIHDLVKVETNLLNIIPNDFLVDNIDEPDIRIYVNYRPQEGFQRIPLRGTLKFQGVSPITLYIKSPRYAFIKSLRPELTKIILTLLEVILLRKGYSFLHAAAISYKGSGVMLVAAPNTGKTFTTLYLASTLNDKEYAVLADDMIIINEKAKAYSYPTPITLTYFHHKILRLKIPPQVKLNLFIRQWVSKALLGKVKGEVKISPRMVFPKLISSIEIDTIIFIEKGSPLVKSLDAKNALARLLTIGRMHRELLSESILYYMSKAGITPDTFLSIQSKIYESIAKTANHLLIKAQTPIDIANTILNLLNKLI